MLTDAVHESHHQRQGPAGQCRSEYPASLGAARHAGHDRHQIRLRRGALRRMHGASGWNTDSLVQHAGFGSGRQESHDDRRRRRNAGRQEGAGRLGRDRRAAVRLLPARPDHDRERAARIESEAERCGHRQRDGRQHLPLRYLSPHQGCSPQSRRHEGSLTMTTLKSVSRRNFLKSGAVVGGGLVIGVQLPHALAKAAVKTSMPNAWIRIGSDNTVTILVARSEMGQGVVMALPTLVAEELEVDMKKIKVDFAPPGEVYINGMLGGQITGGSTSVRDGWDKLRIAGAQARVMLTEAAADEWGGDP